jgi:hypothetical protein
MWPVDLGDAPTSSGGRDRVARDGRGELLIDAQR